MAAIRHKAMTEEDDVRETPIELFAALDEKYRFDLDPCANEQNHLCPVWYGPGSPFAEDGLKASWDGDRVFCNPPFSTIEQWVAKAWAGNPELVVMICPVTRTGLAWWHQLVEPYRDGRGRPGTLGVRGLELHTEFLRGRVQYTVNGGQSIRSKTKLLKSGKGQKQGCMFDTMLLIWS